MCPTQKRCRSAAGKKLSLKRRVKRRFSPPPSSDDGNQTGPESDTSSNAPTRPCCTSNLRPSYSPLSLGCMREPNPDAPLKSTNGRSNRRRLSQTAVYEQQCQKEEIPHPRDLRRGRGRPRKSYLDNFMSDIDTCSTRSNASHLGLSASQSTSELNSQSRAQTATVSDQEEWEVSKVLDERWTKGRNGKIGKQFLVRWKITWIDECDIHAPDLIEQFRARPTRTDYKGLVI